MASKTGITTIHLKQSFIAEVKAEAKSIIKFDVKITNPDAFEILFNEYKKLKKVSA